VPIVGKTGTTDVADQNWLIGTTTKAALAVWVGNTQGHQDLRQITLAGTNGYNTKFNIFRTTMTSLDSNPAYRGDSFPVPDPTLVYGTPGPSPAAPPSPAPTASPSPTPSASPPTKKAPKPTPTPGPKH
jgi:membrane peptidoglycan carboxypeptidase